MAKSVGASMLSPGVVITDNGGGGGGGGGTMKEVNMVSPGFISPGFISTDGGGGEVGGIAANLIPVDEIKIVRENTHPEKLYGFKVNFTTKDANGDIFNEPHTIDGPTGSFNNPLNLKVVTGNIHGPVVVIPLNSKSSSGAYFLKFHLPQPSSSVMFVTFCEKSDKVKDGYYDYAQGVPDKYRNELGNWVLDMKGKDFPEYGKTYTKDLVFRVKGIDTNVASASVEFTISFVSTSSKPATGIELEKS